MTHVSDIKLIRTDTTLDLSQKAEKGIVLKPDPVIDPVDPSGHGSAGLTRVNPGQLQKT